MLPIEEVKSPLLLDEIKERQARLEASLSSINSQLTSLESPVPKTLEKPLEKLPEQPQEAPTDFYSLHRAIATYLTACSADLKGKVLASLTVSFTQMWMQKIQGNPMEKTVTRINVSTPKFKNEVGTVSGIENLMMALGFTLNGNFWEFNETKLKSLREGLRILCEEHSRIKAQEPPKQSSLEQGRTEPAPWEGRDELFSPQNRGLEENKLEG